MMGQFGGMVGRLTHSVEMERGDHRPPFDHVWCLAHRLNLVVADFQNVPYISSVLHFARWFSSKRKAVVYKK